MEEILAYLATFTSDAGFLRVSIILVAALTVFALCLGFSYIFLGAADPIRRCVRDIAEQSGNADTSSDERGRFVTIETIMGPIAKYVVPTEDMERSATLQRLVHAGFRNPNALQTFYGTKAILMVLLPIIVFSVSSWLPDASPDSVMLYALGAMAAGFIGPSYYLDHKLNKRQRALRNGFPDALDMMVVCVEAGLGLTQSIQRVADEIGVSHPELASELALVNAEIRIGVDSVDALRNLSERTGLEDIRGLVSLIVQTLRFGTGIADALRVYAEEFRDKRMQAAEEQAAKMGTKMIFPLVFFMFPGFFVVAVGPAAIKLIEAFSHL